jgi:hypothetical protein
MAERKPAKKDTRESAKSTTAAGNTSNLDDGAMWPTSFALKELTAAEEARIGALVQRAVS